MNNAYADLDPSALAKLLKTLQEQYDLCSANKMALDLTRGKPASEQLALSDGLDDMIDGDYLATDGTDVRNYGGLRGLPEARELGAAIMGLPAEAVIAGGNSSLTLMHFVVACALEQGVVGPAWRQGDEPVRILTPVPGYDRHFALSENFGIEMVNVAMTDAGPDMQQAAELAAADPQIKGIWCVPKYANPTGCVYSPGTVEALAALPKQAAADNFLVLYDNAYAVHDLEFPGVALSSIFDAAAKAHTADHIVQFASTSKITYAGGGIAFIASSETTLQSLEEPMSFMMIGPDKVNQLRHARFLTGRIEAHMQAHAAIIKPKFDIVIEALRAELTGIATWTEPTGGYFISLQMAPGTASAMVELAKGAGLTLTRAGATYPYGYDPQDANVRIAPTFASLADLPSAMAILTLCVRLATAKAFKE
ncbi:MAG: aminotransferase class I/II-fold pyridoxal phosphate-dependent enzyme [Pseudomonadota bacterium]